MANAINTFNYNNNAYVFTLPYGTCGTAAGTAAKAVTVDNFSLETQARVSVKFTYANTVASPTLNVNSTGAKAIYWHGAALTSAQYWEAGAVLDFVYNGTQWELIGVAKDNNTDTNTDTKVTAVGNHYTPAADTSAALSVDASSTTSATWGSTDLVTGVNLQRDAKGHVTGVTVDSIQMPANPNTDTHYTTGLKVGASATATANAAATNGNVYLNVLDNTTVRDSHKIVGSGATTVTSDANGVITISSTDNNTVYTHPSYTARTGVPTANATLTFGGTFTVSQPVSDATGHITAINSRTYTMPSDRLFTTLVPTGTQITSSASSPVDLNTTTYLKVGRYYCSQNVQATTIKNCPLSTAFMMEVYSPLSTTIDNETTSTYVYRLRKITAYSTGIQYIQYVSSGATAGTFTYGSWYAVPRVAFTLDSTDSNGGSATLGSATKPIYSNNGTLTACSTYAGGTAVTLNNSSKAGSTASFYAPTAGGTSGYVLVGAGTTSAPVWKTLANAGIVDLTSAQTVSGVKTFSNGIKIGSATLTYDSTAGALKITFA